MRGRREGAESATRMALEVAFHAAITLASFATCVLALWLAPTRAGKLLSSALVAVGGTATSDRTKAAGAMLLGYLSLLAGGVVLSFGAVPPWVDDAPARHTVLALLGVSLPAAIGAGCAPFVLAPVVAIAEAASVPTAIARSFELAAGRGALASVRDGALSGALFGALAQLLRLAIVWVDERAPMSAVVGLGAVVAVTIFAAIAVLLARTYVAAAKTTSTGGEGALPRSDAHPAATRRIAALIALLIPALASVGAAMIVAAATPTPMREARDMDWEWQHALAEERGVVELGGPHGLRVHRVERGVSIETADGGGAGFVPVEPWAAPPPAHLPDLLVVRTRIGGRDAFAALSNRRVVYFDEEGVRLEDGLAERLSARIGRNTLGAFFLAMILALAWGTRLLRALEEARGLDARATSLAAPTAAGTKARLVGRLRLGEGAVLSVRGTRARLAGDARVVSLDGEVALALPREVRLFGPHDAAVPKDGDEIEVLGHLGSLAPVGLREGAIVPWPEGAQLLLGSRAVAADRLLTRAAGEGALVAAAVALLLVLVALSIVTAL